MKAPGENSDREEYPDEEPDDGEGEDAPNAFDRQIDVDRTGHDRDDRNAFKLQQFDYAGIL